MNYTSIQSYRKILEHFPLPSLSLLSKIHSGKIDAVKCAQTLSNEDKISNDVCLMFDEMYLQKCEEYFAGDLVGCNSEVELYKRLVCLMIVGLKNSIPDVIKSSAEMLFGSRRNFLEIFSGFFPNVKAIVCENHPSNVSSF